MYIRWHTKKCFYFAHLDASHAMWRVFFLPRSFRLNTNICFIYAFSCTTCNVELQRESAMNVKGKTYCYNCSVAAGADQCAGCGYEVIQHTPQPTHINYVLITASLQNLLLQLRAPTSALAVGMKLYNTQYNQHTLTHVLITASLQKPIATTAAPLRHHSKKHTQHTQYLTLLCALTCFLLCSKPIITGTIAKAGAKKYHPDCLKCEKCSGSLAEGFRVRRNKMYCVGCSSTLGGL